MVEDHESLEFKLAALPRLVRDQRLVEAGELLDSLIAAAPEVAARWLVLGRLMGLDPERWDRQVQTALGQFGAAPLAAYRRANRVLDQLHADAEAVRRLESWSRRWSEAVPAESERVGALERKSEAVGESERIRKLESWLQRLGERRADWRLDSPRRRVARLESLATRLEQLPPRSHARTQRWIGRLEAWQGAWPEGGSQ
ncbi:MAG: hypothetical protein HQL99_10090 [Magnetococcales bacterium]|nr:hypothetical protein [Magnetococcales bacterium]